MASAEQEKEWQERVAQWSASGLSQRAFALEHGFTQKQISNWSRRVAGVRPAQEFVPVRVTPAIAADAVGTGVVELIDARQKRPQFRSVFRFLPTPAYRSWSSCLVRTH
ncbi:IS66 family insertion sequence element accessory protein TnpA [Massilia sp. DWR3-1-1]|uniref:IS66 family insertion sequence element accessory protein TnpA n=1 Tax=Massilia sp. DWR3-1-1 TaxID=2804559 RepID=UPI003CEC6815